MPIRLKLTILFLLTALIPLLLISVLTFNQYKKSLESLRISQLENTAVFKAGKIENYLSTLKTYAQIIQNKYIIKQNFPILVKGAGALGPIVL